MLRFRPAARPSLRPVVCSLLPAFAILASPSVHAAFNAAGVETFDGTSPDTTTWVKQDFGSFSQNDAITLDNVTYSTVAQTVAVGEGVRVDISNLSFTGGQVREGEIELYLTNRDPGGSQPDSDTQQARLNFDVENGAAQLIINNITGGDFVTGLSIQNTYTLELFRNTADNFTARVYDSNGGLLGEQTRSNRTDLRPPFTDNLFIALQADFGATGTFDNVTVGIPEPATLTLLGSLATLLLRRR